MQTGLIQLKHYTLTQDRQVPITKPLNDTGLLIHKSHVGFSALSLLIEVMKVYLFKRKELTSGP